MQPSCRTAKSFDARRRYPLICTAIRIMTFSSPWLAMWLPVDKTCAATTINSSTATVFLQILDPASSTFVAPATTVINNTGTNVGILGDNSKSWQLTNYGSISAIGGGVLLGAASASGAQLDNYGSISGTNSDLAAGVQLTNGGVIRNHAGASIDSAQFYGILPMGGASVTIVNDGDISGSSGAIRLGIGGSVTQSSTGRIMGINGSPGLVIDDGAYMVNSAGSITATGSPAVSVRGASNGVITNSGSISGGIGVQMQSSAGGVLLNSGTITGINGTAISMTGNNNQLVLQTGSVLNGSVTSSGTNNTLALQGTGASSNTFREGLHNPFSVH